MGWEKSSTAATEGRPTFRRKVAQCKFSGAGRVAFNVYRNDLEEEATRLMLVLWLEERRQAGSRRCKGRKGVRVMVMECEELKGQTIFS